MIQITALVDKGIERDNNEDRAFVNGTILDDGKYNFTIDDTNETLISEIPYLFIICDGVGGENGGEIAAEAALMTFKELMSLEDINEEDIISSTQKANEAIVNLQKQNPNFSKMATTISGVYIKGDKYIVFNAGDSKIYRYRAPYIAQLSTDHTLVNELLEIGAISSRDEAMPGQRHTITHYLGSKNPSVSELSIESGSISPGDVFIISSDGLSEGVDYKEIEYIMKQGKSDSETIDELYSRATKNGSLDNISIMLINIIKERDEEEEI